MGKHCFVPNCNSGYRSCAETVSVFRVPSDPARLEKWRRAIPRADRILLSSDHVCAKHFPPEMVSRSYYGELDGKVLLDAPKKPVLSVDAVPSIFPGCPTYLTRHKKPRKPPRRRVPATTSVCKRRHSKSSVTNVSLESSRASSTSAGSSAEVVYPEHNDPQTTAGSCKRPRLDSSSIASPVLCSERDDPRAATESCERRRLNPSCVASSVVYPEHGDPEAGRGHCGGIHQDVAKVNFVVESL
ncbi:unnamed protein product [Ixodes hexagonus]